MKELFKSFMPGIDRHLKNGQSNCGNGSCHNRQLIRRFSGERHGIAVGSVWYCCLDCFAMAAVSPLERLSSRQAREIPRQPRLSLGLFLLSKGYLTAGQLHVATAQSQCRDENIEYTLARLGMVTEEALAAARSAQWGYPMLAPDSIGQQVELEIPKLLLNACRAVPLHYSAATRRILLGFAACVDHRFIESIEELTRCRVEPCVITPTDFEEQMERVKIPPHYDQVVVDDPGSPIKMARAGGWTAVQVGATEAIFAQWRKFVLVRVAGKRGKADIVFAPPQNATVEIGAESGIFRGAIAS